VLDILEMTIVNGRNPPRRLTNAVVPLMLVYEVRMIRTAATHPVEERANA